MVFAERASPDKMVERCSRILGIALLIIRKRHDQEGFIVRARRWVVERTGAWLTSWRRLARDCERHHPATSEATIRWAAIGTITHP